MPNSATQSAKRLPRKIWKFVWVDNSSRSKVSHVSDCLPVHNG